MLVEKTKQRGMYIERDFEYIQDKIEGNSAVKQDKKDKLIVAIDGVPFNADTMSIGYMGAVVNLAGYKYDKLIVDGKSDSDANDASYGATINWKCADNVVREVSVDTIAVALELSLGAIANIVGV